MKSDPVERYLETYSYATAKQYRRDLADFAVFRGATDAAAAIDAVCSGTSAAGHDAALGYRTYLLGRGLAPATIARRLAALRSVLKVARTLGRMDWALEVDSPRSETYRDTRGPGLDGWRRLRALAVSEATSAAGRRNLAMVLMLHDLALRRAELVAIDLADLDLPGGTVAIVGKGKREPVRLTMPRAIMAALAEWLKDRGSAAGPLFPRLDRAGQGRLTGEGLAGILDELGRRAGLGRKLRPHGLRHQAITRCLDLSGGDVRRVRMFSRHAKVETLLKYDDNRRDEAGNFARMLGDDDAPDG